MKHTKNKLLVLLLIGILFFIPFVLSYGTDEDLKYKVYSSGTCSIATVSSTGETLNYDISVVTSYSGNTISQTFDGTPALPASSYTGNFGYNYCGIFGLNFNDLNFWDLVEKGKISGVVDYCPDGNIIDPFLNGKPDYKCNQLCVPNKAICSSIDILRKCASDGNGISSVSCVYGCDDTINACRDPEKNIIVSTNQETYSLGENVNVTGTFISGGKPVEGVPMIAQLTKNAVLKELQATTDANGKAYFNFPSIDSAGEITVHLNVPTYLGRGFDESKIIRVVGNSIVYEVATYSYTQYSNKNITFTVKLKDSNGLVITPSQLTNLHSVSSLTQGNVYSGAVTYIGDGVYQVDSQVDGSGSFVGKLAFTFEGLPQSSPIITIAVRPMGISIDASQISPSAILNETKTYTINTFDSSGTKLNPDSITIKVSYPDGTTAKEIPFSQITKISDGVYQFSFTFDQVEKFTFNIYADYSNYARGSVMASVAVGGYQEGSSIGGLVGSLSSNIQWYLLAGVIVSIIYFGRGKKRR